MMSEFDISDEPPDGYDVGYRKPPRTNQFRPGKSGNPRGRPKGTKNLGKVLQDALQRRVTIKENGRERKMRAQDVIISGLVNDAARRDPSAVRLIFALIDRYAAGDEREADLVFDHEDQEIIESYLARRAREKADNGNLR
jgi:Family of unknown function (DUF5681)